MDYQDFNWKELRKIKIKNYIIFSYIMSLLLLGMMFLEFFSRFDFGIFPYLTAAIPSLMLIIYLVTKYLSNKSIICNPSKNNYFLFIIFISLITFLIYKNVTFNKHFLKVYYFIPIILAAVNYSQFFGFFIAGYSTLNLLVLNYLLIDFSKLDFDIIIIILFFWIAWLIGGFIDLEQRIQNYLEKMAVTDDLTSLPNYVNFQTTLDSWLEEAKNKQFPLSLVLMDLDNFKFFNDSLGHQKGDELLKEIAVLVEEQIEKDIFFARYGGDEFAFLLFNYEQEAAFQKVKQIKSRVQQEINIPYEDFLEKKPTFSLGVASFPEQALTKKELIDMADYALYQAKTTQKDQVKIYHEALSDLAAELEESERELFNSIRTLLSIINAKDRYTYGHSERVAKYAAKFAEKLELSSAEIKKLIYGAFLHDVGKIEIKREILMKQERLDESEWRMIKRHPEIGSQILDPLQSCQEIIPMIHYHHENFDGTGYPEGLKENEIPFYARILRIIDSFDAITTERPYSSAFSKKEALKELKKEAGRQFDPQLVKVFLKVAEEDILLNKN